MEMEMSRREETCSNGAHVFDTHSEICKCGELPRHRAVRCAHCGNTYWTRQATNPEQRKEANEKQIGNIRESGNK